MNSAITNKPLKRVITIFITLYNIYMFLCLCRGHWHSIMILTTKINTTSTASLKNVNFMTTAVTERQRLRHYTQIWVRFPVWLIYWLIFSVLFLNCQTNSRKFRLHLQQENLWSFIIRIIFISVLTVTVSDLTCNTWQSFVGQVAQEAQWLTTGWTARVRSRAAEVCRFT